MPGLHNEGREGDQSLDDRRVPKGVGAGRKVILFEDAETNWEVPWLDSCSAEGILSL